MRHDKFLQFLELQLEELAGQLGRDWPPVHDALLQRAQELAEERDPDRWLWRLNRIVRVFRGTPAEPTIRRLLVAAAEGDEKEGTLRLGASLRAIMSGGRFTRSGPALTTAEVRRLRPTVLSLCLSLADTLTAVADDVDVDYDGRPGDDNNGGDGTPPAAEEVIGDETPPPDRKINAWLEGPTPLSVGERRALHLNIGAPRAGSLVAESDSHVPGEDVGAGMQTEWIIDSTDVELALAQEEGTPPADVGSPPGKDEGWTVRFPLAVPMRGDSIIRTLWVRARRPEGGRLKVFVFSVGARFRELYRRFEIVLAPSGPASVRADSVAGPLSQMALRTTHEWTTPPERLTILVSDASRAFLMGTVGGRNLQGRRVNWRGAAPTMTQPIQALRLAVEQLLNAHTPYFDDIDAADLLRRLTAYRPERDWRTPTMSLDAAHQQAWDQVRTSAALRDVAARGRLLYEAAFPPGEEVRDWLDRLEPGARLDLNWTDAIDSYVAAVPWGLMYVGDLPGPGQPLDPLGFLALRFRLSYQAFVGNARGDRALVESGQVPQSFCLYWGQLPGDTTGVESTWQRGHFAGSSRMLVPQVPGTATARADVLDAIHGTAQDSPPASVVYLYCQGGAGSNGDPFLRFDDSRRPEDQLSALDLLVAGRLGAEPLMFANACRSSAAAPVTANALQHALFSRGCRAFIGTETQVPIVLASRFAAVFFHFFGRQADPDPMSAGEALAQARRFLFKEYGNLGGLLYALINQYDLYLATVAEIRELHDA